MDTTQREEALTAYGTETGQSLVPIPETALIVCTTHLRGQLHTILEDMDRYPNAYLEELKAFLTLWDVKPQVEESSLETLSVDELITQLRQVCEDAEDRASNAQEEARQKRKEALKEVVQQIYCAVGLTRWFEKLESQFRISNVAEGDRVKFVSSTLVDSALTWIDDPNMTMEEYIRLEEEKARRRGRVCNWQTATYGKIRVSDDLYDLRSMEAEFPAIVINDAFAPQDALPCKSQMCHLAFRSTLSGEVGEDLQSGDTQGSGCGFFGMPELIRDGLFARIVMEHRDDAGVVVFTSRARGRLFDTRGPLVRELVLEFFSTLRFGEVLLDLDAPDTIQF
ncbi:hypothetical protein Tco_0863058 [Tanacetum coccineum]